MTRTSSCTSSSVASGAAASAGPKLVRNGVSLMKSTHRNAASANGTAIRNRCPVASPIAAS